MTYYVMDSDYDTYSSLSPGDELIELYWDARNVDINRMSMYDEITLEGGPLRHAEVYVRITYPRLIFIKKVMLEKHG